MIELSPFRNSDSPGIVAVWNDQLPLRGRVRILTTALFEQYVLSKPYFDPRGLIVARESGRVIGFSHVGFSPGVNHGELRTQEGVVCQIAVASRPDVTEVSNLLLQAGESFLQGQGAMTIYGGGYREFGPFYLGLYGGCRLPGVLVGDATFNRALQARGYAKEETTIIWERDLSTFRPPVDRELMAIRRQYQLQLQSNFDDCWRDACAFGWFERTRFDISECGKSTCCGSLTFWDMEPLASNWGLRAMGLADATVPADPRGGNLLSCLLGEAMRQFQTQGISMVEVQTADDESMLADACRRLGFNEVDQGFQFRRNS